MISKIIVPNLDRRADRWYTCLGALLILEYRRETIIRFSAHDGNDYESFDSARRAATTQFPDSTYLRENSLGKHYYCWSWTWYDIMTQIANDGHGDLVIFLVDDYAPRCRRHQLEDDLRILNSRHPIKCVQLGINEQRPPGFTQDDDLTLGKKIPSVNFYEGIHASGDVTNIYSPQGAAEIISIADSGRPLSVPNSVFYLAGHMLANARGYYTVSIDKGLGKRLHHPRYIDPFQDARNH